MSSFHIENIFHLCFKTIYLNEEDNCTEPQLAFPVTTQTNFTPPLPKNDSNTTMKNSFPGGRRLSQASAWLWQQRSSRIVVTMFDNLSGTSFWCKNFSKFYQLYSSAWRRDRTNLFTCWSQTSDTAHWWGLSRTNVMGSRLTLSDWVIYFLPMVFAES